MFDQAPDVPPNEGAVNMGCGLTANVWNLQPQAGAQ